MPSTTRSRLLPQILCWLVVLSPSWVHLSRLSSYGELQGNDYYGIVDRIADGETLTADPARWLALKANEHRVTLPVLIYVANMRLTHGHNLGLSVFALALLACTVWMLVGLLPPDLRSVAWLRTAIGFGIAGLCFTPVVAHSVAMGFSGTIWFLANALAVAAVAALTRRAAPEKAWALWPVMLFGLAAAFCHSTHLILWPVLLVGGCLLGVGRRGLIALAAGCTAVYALFVLTYIPFARHPVPNTSDFTDLLRYVAIYLGSLFSSDLTLARTVGLVGLVASAVLAWAVLVSGMVRPFRRELAPWLLIQLYGLGNGVMTAVSRSGFGEHQATASRYASLAALFWIGLVTPLAVLAWRFRPAGRRGRVILAATSAALGLSLGAGMSERGDELLERFVKRGERQRVAALALALGIRDDDILSRAVTPAPAQVWAVTDFLRAARQVPFDREPRWRADEQVAAARLAPRQHEAVRGELDRVVVLPGGYVRLGGWAFAPDATVDEVLVLDQSATVRGEIFTEIRRPELARRVRPEALTAGWEGYARADPAQGELRAYVRLAGDATLYPLPTRRRVARQMKWEEDVAGGS